MKSSTNNILVPLGFSEQSKIALKQAENFAKIIGAEITLLSVVEESGMFRRLFGDDEEKLYEIKKDIQVKLDELAKESQDRTGIIVNAIVSRGKVYDKIVETAEMMNASYIIMGTEGEPRDFSRKLMGSNAYRVVTTAKTPVITIKGKKHRSHCNNIILPLDMEKETKEKVSYAIDLAKKWGATVKVVSVTVGRDEEVKAQMLMNLNQVEEILTSNGVKCKTETIRGHKRETLAEAVMNYAEKEDGDLIMIMTQQELDFTTNFLGSSAQAIIYKSEIPVMCIRPSSRGEFSYGNHV